MPFRLFSACLLLLAVGAPCLADDGGLVMLDVTAVGPAALEDLQSIPHVKWWVEGEDRLLLATGPGLETELDALGLDWHRVTGTTDLEAWALVPARPCHAVDPVLTGGRLALVPIPEAGLAALADDGEGHHHTVARRLTGSTVLARSAANLPPPAGPPPATRLSLSDHAAAVDPQRWLSDVVTLASWNRWTHGSGIHLARDWLAARFSELDGLTVTTPSFSVGTTTAYNVAARLEGSSLPGSVVVVGAHYDATSETPSRAAPGAEDNASGCAGVLELARILAQRPPKRSIEFICYSGEEQGLYGSENHASSLVAAGADDDVVAMLNMDMIGYTGDAELDVLLETSSTHAWLMDILRGAAQRHASLVVDVSYNPFGSDHVPYLNRGMPALLAIENDWSVYPDYHSSTDLPGNLSTAMGGEILRMMAAGLARLAAEITPGDATADARVDAADLAEIVALLADPDRSPVGDADCSLDGSVTAEDPVCVAEAIFAAP